METVMTIRIVREAWELVLKIDEIGADIWEITQVAGLLLPECICQMSDILDDKLSDSSGQKAKISAIGILAA